MNNIRTNVEGEDLVIRVKIGETGTLSESQKNYLVASSGGNVPIPGTDLKLGMNIMRKNASYVAPAK